MQLRVKKGEKKKKWEKIYGCSDDEDADGLCNRNEEAGETVRWRQMIGCGYLWREQLKPEEEEQEEEEEANPTTETTLVIQFLSLVNWLWIGNDRESIFGLCSTLIYVATWKDAAAQNLIKLF